jgi:DNA processing protein
MAKHADAEAAVVNGVVADTLAQNPDNRKSISRNLDRRLKHNTQAIGLFDAAYPVQLREIPDPPLVLYCQGNPDALHEPAIALVGARRCTSQGRLLAEQLAQELASCGLTIVSGLALGIDGAAHRGALRGASLGAKSGTTIAVLGSGLGRLYPSRHQQLAANIVAAGGVLLSEYTHTCGPRAFHFPERNRLISGLGRATVVVEASERSGSLITARLALEQGRDVMAVPGPVHSLVSAGCHRLIQQGAALITCAEDVLLALGSEAALLSAAADGEHIHQHQAVEKNMPSAQHQQVFDCIGGYPVNLDELCLKTGLQAAQVSTVIVNLELMGFVQQVALGYIRSP